MEGHRIRRAHRDDAEALGKLGASLMHAHFAFDATRFLSPGANAEAGYASFLSAQLDSDDALVMVAERDDSGAPRRISGRSGCFSDMGSGRRWWR